MTLDLNLILGHSPEEATIILFGFLKQNQLFEALAGFTPSYVGVQFLSELTTICSMIGLLVLVFSPSLWKAKYIISWTFLFVLITLGGVLGNTFGYNFTSATGLNAISTPYGASKNVCDTEIQHQNNGVCPNLSAPEYAQVKATLEATGRHPDTIGSTVGKGDSSGKISMDGNNQVTGISIVAFYPQVLAMHITNKLEVELRNALYNLENRIKDNKDKLLETVAHAGMPNSQLETNTALFDSICGDHLQAAGYSTASALAIPPSHSGNIYQILSERQIVAEDMVKVAQNAKIIGKKDGNTIPILADISGPDNPESFAKFRNTMNNPTEKEKALLDYLSINNNFSVENDPDADPTVYRTYDNNMDTGQYKKIARSAGFDMARKDYDTVAIDVFNDPESNIKANDPIALIIPNVEVTPEEERAMQKARAARKDSWLHGNNGVVSFGTETGPNEILSKIENVSTNTKRVTNCGQMYDNLMKNFENGQINNLKNLKQIIKSEIGDNCPENMESCYGSDRYRSKIQDLSPKTHASIALFSLAEAVKANCKQGEEALCEKQLDQAVYIYRQSAVNNALRKRDAALQKSQETGVDQKGVAYNFGSGMVNVFGGVLTYAKSLFASFEAGAYRKLMPIIKNIILAFVLVCTPILFLLGLLVPSWAPGVLATSIISVFFLQMVDVTMILVESVLQAIQSTIVQSNAVSEDGFTYNNLIDVIWSMAYTAVFGITAFLMFAAGNTQAILGKLAGIDSTIQSASKQIAYKGAEITMSAAKIAAGVATGGAAGGALGAKAAGMVANTASTANSIATRGLGATLDGLSGSVGGNYAGMYNSHQNKLAERLGTDKANLNEYRQKESVKNAIFDEKVEQIADKPAIEAEKMQIASTERKLGAKRPRDDDAAIIKMSQTAFDGKSKQPYGDKNIKTDSLQLGSYTTKDENNKQVKVNLLGRHQEFQEGGAQIMRDVLMNDTKDDSPIQNKLDRSLAMAQGANYALAQSFNAEEKRVIIDGKHYSKANGSAKDIKNNIRESMTNSYTNMGISTTNSNFESDVNKAFEKTMGNHIMKDGNIYFEAKESMKTPNSAQNTSKPGGRTNAEKVKSHTDFAKNMK